MIDRGSVVIRNGRIVSVGAGGATAPAGQTIDARGMSLMSGGGPIPGIIELKQRIEKGQLKGPRIITSGRADPDLFKTPAEARAGVQKLAQAGVEIIKARLDPPAAPEQVAMLTVVVDEARKHNLDVMVHAASPASMLAAVKAGARKLVHTPHGGWLTEADARVVRDAGVVYGYGTDTGYHPLAGLAHELKALNLMFSPQDIVKLMGPNTAAFIEKSQDLGTLEPGKLADIVILDGYWNLLNAKVVIKGGAIVVDKR